MKKTLLNIFCGVLILSTLSQLISCEKDQEQIPAPTIESFSPTSGLASTDHALGDVVMILGNNFRAPASDNIIKFNGVVAPVQGGTSTQLSTTVPAGATTGKITVTTAGGTATSSTDFVVLPVPTITSFSPSSGLANVTTVIITGTHFSATLSENEVKFNGVTAVISEASTTQLTVVAPAGATSGKITVTTNGTAATSINDFTIISLPTITGFSPAYGLPGTPITITGTNLTGGATGTSNFQFKINGIIASLAPAEVNDSQLQILIPEGSTTGKITIHWPSNEPALHTTSSDFEVLSDIPRNGLIAFYPFSGNVNDVSGNNLHGTLGAASAAPIQTIDRFGKPNQAYEFDGADDFITMGNPPLLQIKDQFTVSGWFNIDNFKTNANGDIQPMEVISKLVFNSNGPTGGFNISQAATFNDNFPYLGVFAFNSNGSLSYSNAVSGGSIIALDQWMFISLVVDGTSLKFYLNGVLTNGNTTVNTNIDGTAADLIIGSRRGTSTFFNGFIDDITIYNRGLSSAEIQQLFQQTITKY